MKNVYEILRDVIEQEIKNGNEINKIHFQIQVFSDITGTGIMDTKTISFEVDAY